MIPPFHWAADKRAAGCALGALALSLFMFAPRLWLMRAYVPGTFQWDRAHSFLLQCSSPFRHDVEPAMFWRLLPPLVCHWAGLSGLLPLVVPWLGVCACALYVAAVLQRSGAPSGHGLSVSSEGASRGEVPGRPPPDLRFVAGGTLLFATTSAVLVPVGWLGINDAWVWLGLLAVAFSRRRLSFAAACLLCPWIDERFLIGFPLAWVVRQIDRNEPLFTRQALQALWLIPYPLVRIVAGGFPVGSGPAASLLRAHLGTLATLVPFAPLGWWMALRAAWIPVVYGVWSLAGPRRWLVATAIAATLVVMVGLAADLSRSAAIVVPAMLWGCLAFARRHPASAPRGLLLLGVVNLLIPAAHVVSTKIDLINPLLVELVRLARIP